MFTGIVTAVGRVSRATANGAGLALSVRAPYRGLRRGESIAVNGACLTVERVVKGGFTAHVVPTTLGRTLFAEYASGRRVNLERALRAADRFGGHFVQGHVDGVGRVVRVRRERNGQAAWTVDLAVPVEVREVSLLHGAVTVDGVSLTVNALPDQATLQIALVPYTREHTTLGALAPGDRVHVEGDVMAKYVRELCRSRA
jgi:riboflavin synthase